MTAIRFDEGFEKQEWHDGNLHRPAAKLDDLLVAYGGFRVPATALMNEDEIRKNLVAPLVGLIQEALL